MNILLYPSYRELYQHDPVFAREKVIVDQGVIDQGAKHE